MLTNVTLSTKEKFLLEDAKSQEEQCVLKYRNYSKLACDPELKSIFQSIEKTEVNHLNTISELLNGTIPPASSSGSSSQQSSGSSSQQGSSSSSQQSSGSMSSSSSSSMHSSASMPSASASSMQGSASMSSSGSSSQSSASSSGSMSSASSSGFQASDKDLCSDALSIEKYISSVYNTAIFEFKDTQVRNILNHIQKEEQQHGEQIFNYMNSHGMYSMK